LVGVDDAMDHSDGGEYSKYPQHGSHRMPVVEHGSDDHQNDSLRALHESHLAGANQRFRAGARITHQHGADHHEGHQYEIEKPVGAGIVNQQAEEQDYVAVAVNHGIEKAAKRGDLTGSARHAAVHHIKNAGAYDHQTGVEEQAIMVLRVSVAEENAGNGVDYQSDKRKHVWRNAGQGQAAHDNVQQHPATAPKSSCPGHCASSWMVVRFRISISRLPLGVTTTAVSPTLLPIRALPMGEVVDINPLLTSDSSLVTSLYSISSSLLLSNTRTREPNATQSLGM